MKAHTAARALLLRNFTFGVEDSLASTVGLLSGIASADIASSTIILTGVILVFTEALAMGVGSFLSEQSVSEYEHGRDLPLKRSLPSAVVMFFSYLISGIIPIAPYAIFLMPWALYLSVISAIISLMLLGFFNASLSHTAKSRAVWRMVVLGGSVAIAGVVIGRLLRGLSGYAM
jgi:VIT1/CCC1 family predicted Fe2+/Mn2+ transporter